MFFLSARKYDPGFSSRIRIRIFYPRIQGSKGHHFSDPQRLQNFSPRSYQKKCFSPKIKSKDVLTRGQRQYADQGSGVLLTPGSGMGKKSGSGSRIWIEQPGSYFRELKYLKFFDADPERKKLRSEIENIRICTELTLLTQLFSLRPCFSARQDVQRLVLGNLPWG